MLRKTRRIDNVITWIGKPEDVYRWSIRWLQAERDRGPKPAEELAFLEAHLKRMTELHEVVKQLGKDLIPHEEELKSEWYRLEAQLWLAQAKAK